MCEVYYISVAGNIRFVFFKKHVADVYIENIDPCGTPNAILGAVGIMYFCSLFSLIKVTENKT